MDAFDSDLSDDARDEALWQLLGRARPVEASPYFTRKVLREIRMEPARPWWHRSRLPRFFLRTVAPAALCAGIAVLAIVGPMPKAPDVASSDIEFETIQNLDLMVSNYESSIWLDPSSSSH